MLGIIAALKEEIDRLLSEMQVKTVCHLGGRDYHVGMLWGVDCVVVLCRIGKVAAATTATQLIVGFDVQRVLFTGVAGGLHPDIAVGDVVIATALLQQDLDASPLFPRYEVPLTGKTYLETDPSLTRTLHQATHGWLATQAQTATLHQGLIVSGDTFIGTEAQRNDLTQRLPAALCVEMEGAAVAQVCADYDVPLAVMRTISDSANADAALDFATFVKDVASVYALGIVRMWLQSAG